MNGAMAIKADLAVADKVRAMDDDALFYELRVIVNAARFVGTYDVRMTKAIGAECRRRGWKVKVA